MRSFPPRPPPRCAALPLRWSSRQHLLADELTCDHELLNLRGAVADHGPGDVSQHRLQRHLVDSVDGFAAGARLWRSLANRAFKGSLTVEEGQMPSGSEAGKA